MTINRAKFEELAQPVFEKLREPCLKCLKDAGVEAGDIDEVILVGGSTRIPKVQEIVEDIFGKPPHKGVNPDEVVAIGAAIQGGVLAGEVEDVVLVDVTPLSLGIETLGGVMTTLIERNTSIPHSKKEIFSTAADNQTSVEIHVLQGERSMAAHNRTLGRFQLAGIPPAPRGVPQIEVSFDMDANGILSVTARDLGTGKEQQIEIKSDSGLSDEEVKQMREDAEKHAEEDQAQRELIETRNRADQLAYSTEKTLQEHGDKLSADDRQGVEQAIEELRRVKDGDDKGEIESKIQALQQASHRLAEAIYKQSKAQQGAAADAAQTPAEEGDQDEDVVDADFEVKD